MLDKNELPPVLVTGSSGYVGSHLTKKMATSGRAVVSLYRNRIPENSFNVFPVCSDLSSVELLAAPLRGVQTVVHLAWNGSFINAKNKKSKMNNLSALKNLLKASEEAQVERFIFLSATGASCDASSDFLSEKYLGELLTFNSKVPERIVLRSSILFGGKESSDKFINKIKEFMNFPIFYPVPKFKQNISPLFYDDLATTIYRLVEKNSGEGSFLLEISGKEGYQIEDIFKYVSKKMGVHKFPLKSFLGKPLISFTEKWKSKEGSDPSLENFLEVGSCSKLLDKKYFLSNNLNIDNFRTLKEEFSRDS